MYGFVDPSCRHPAWPFVPSQARETQRAVGLLLRTAARKTAAPRLRCNRSSACPSQPRQLGRSRLLLGGDHMTRGGGGGGERGRGGGRQRQKGQRD